MPPQVLVAIHDLHEFHARLPNPEHRLGIGCRPDLQHVEKQVMRQLVIRSRVFEQLLRARLLCDTDESRPSPARPECGIDDVSNPLGRFGVEHELAVGRTFVIGPHSKRPSLVLREKSCFGAQRIEQISKRAGLLCQFFNRHVCGIRHKFFRGKQPGGTRNAPVICRLAAGRLAETTSDCIVLSRREHAAAQPGV